MASKQKETRLAQIEKYQLLLTNRKTELQNKEHTEDEISKDKALKRLMAEIKRAKNAVSAIEKREKIQKDARKPKAEKPAKGSSEKKSIKDADAKEKSQKKKK